MEHKMKYLEFLQGIITRMNSNSFLIKGWAVTIMSALFALAAKDANGKFVMITFISTAVFWGLDGYYLSLEKQFRKLYDVASSLADSDPITYSMNIDGLDTGEASWGSCLIRPSVLGLYATLVIIALIVMFVLPRIN